MVKVKIDANAIITEHPDMVAVKIVDGEDFHANASYVSANGYYFKDGKHISV